MAFSRPLWIVFPNGPPPALRQPWGSGRMPDCFPRPLLDPEARPRGKAVTIPAMNATLMHTVATALLAAVVGAQVSVPDAVLSAVGKARKDNMRVLLVCGDDGIRAQLSGPLSRLILYEYVVVELPVDSPYGQTFGPAGVNGGAFLAILDNRYQSLATTAAAELSDVAATEAFLTAHQAKYLDANSVYDKALALAKKTNRRVFVHLGAPGEAGANGSRSSSGNRRSMPSSPRTTSS